MRIPTAWVAVGVLAMGLLAGGLGFHTLTDDSEGALPASRADAAFAAYEHYWRWYVEAQNPPTAETNAAAHLAGPELRRVTRMIEARRDAHQGLRGRYSHQGQTVTFVGANAQVDDCLRLHTAIYDVRTGKRVRTDRQGPFPVTATLVRDGGTWKVSEVEQGAFPCPRPQTSPLPSSTSGAE